VKHTLPHIPEEEQTPAVRLLMAFTEQQQADIESLKAEIARLKKLPPKPKIRPSKISRPAIASLFDLNDNQPR